MKSELLPLIFEIEKDATFKVSIINDKLVGEIYVAEISVSLKLTLLSVDVKLDPDTVIVFILFNHDET